MGYEKPKDYNEVQDRILEFREKHPDGSLQSDEPIWVRDGKGEIVGVTVRTFAYRTPDDVRPGVGTAYEVFPGKTPYTKCSEVMNAETSAWGRALIAVGAADAKKGIASGNEIRGARAANRRGGDMDDAAGEDDAAGGDDSADDDPVEAALWDARKALKRGKVPKAALEELIEGFDVKAYRDDEGWKLSLVSDVKHLGEIAQWAENYKE